MWLIKNTGDVNVVAYYLMSMCAVTVVVTAFNLKKS
jgi:hypothetical protein